MPFTTKTPRPSQYVRSRPSQSVYFLMRSGVNPWTFLSAINSETAPAMVCALSSAKGEVVRPANWSSRSRLAFSASTQERVPAVFRYWTPLWVQRRCFRQLHRRYSSSSACLHSAEWRTKMAIRGVLICREV
jgi:hypothetical protein